MLIPFLVGRAQVSSSQANLNESQPAQYEVGEIKWVYDYKAGVAYEFVASEIGKPMYIHPETNDVYVPYEPTGNKRKILIDSDGRTFKAEIQDILYGDKSYEKIIELERKGFFTFFPQIERQIRVYHLERETVSYEDHTERMKDKGYCGYFLAICAGFVFLAAFILRDDVWEGKELIMFVILVIGVASFASIFAIIYTIIFVGIIAIAVIGIYFYILYIDHIEDYGKFKNEAKNNNQPYTYLDFLCYRAGVLRKTIWNRVATLGDHSPHPEE